MMRTIIYTILCFLGASILGYLSYISNCEQFNRLSSDTLLQVLATVFAINIGILPILFYELNKIEKEIGMPGDFFVVKKGIRLNAVVITFLFILSIGIVIIKNLISTGIEYALSSIILGSVFLAIVMMYDVVSCILALDPAVDKIK